MSDLEFRTLGNDDEIMHRRFIKEFIAAGEKITPSAADLFGLSFSEWLKKREKIASGIDLSKDRVPATLYFLIRKSDQKILGAIDVRHRLNENLKQIGGNIGYGVAPSERRKGYASHMLTKALKICRELGMMKVLITCDKDNIASAKTILKQGGILENEVPSDSGVPKQRYWIDL